MDKYCEDCVHNEVCRYEAYCPSGHCNDKETIDDLRPQGEWIDTGYMEEYWSEEYRCSVCGAKDHWHNFCPNCGADMRKGSAE